MAKYLIVIDYQYDFVCGVLGSEAAQKIFKKVREKIAQRIKEGWHVIFTFDTHGKNYMNTQEGKNLPVQHCIEGTQGWEIYGNLILEAEQLIKNYNLELELSKQTPNPLHVKKYTFGYTEWKYLIPDAKEIEVIGVCTDICVVSNVLILKAQFPEIPISVDAACCAGVTEESHNAALRTMQSCQILVYNMPLVA